jgi:hydrogenase assembly chaperone HypC/HupF
VSARETEPAACHDLGSGHCVTCSDEGVPMRVLALEPTGGSLVRCTGADGVAATVETALVGPVEPGDVVLVHAGVALVRLDAEWAP